MLWSTSARKGTAMPEHGRGLTRALTTVTRILRTDPRRSGPLTTVVSRDRDRVVDCSLYTRGRRDPVPRTYAEALALARSTPDAFVWVDLRDPGPDEMNGSFTQSGSQLTVTNASYNGALAAGAATTFGFLGSGNTASPDSVTCTSP